MSTLSFHARCPRLPTDLLSEFHGLHAERRTIERNPNRAKDALLDPRTALGPFELCKYSQELTTQLSPSPLFSARSRRHASPPPLTPMMLTASCFTPTSPNYNVCTRDAPTLACSSPHLRHDRLRPRFEGPCAETIMNLYVSLQSRLPILAAAIIQGGLQAALSPR